MGTKIKCVRADSFSESKTIQDDIWQNIAKADVLIVDVTNLNPNVMLEYGVAAALRPPTQVIVIKSADDKLEHPFDVKPLRYLLYSRSILGGVTSNTFIEGLYQSMLEALAPTSSHTSFSGHERQRVFCRYAKRRQARLDSSPGVAHRRTIDDGLEFGSFTSIQNPGSNSQLRTTRTSEHEFSFGSRNSSLMACKRTSIHSLAWPSGASMSMLIGVAS